MKIKVITKKLLADLQTPVGLYLKLRDIYAESALLESSDFHDKEDSSSYIGFCPIAKFKLENEKITTDILGKKSEKDLNNKLTQELDFFIKSFTLEGEVSIPNNGFFGYASYDAVRYFETIDTKNIKLKNAEVPDLYYIFYRFILIINHLKNELTIVENIPEDEETQIEKLEALIQNHNFASYDFYIDGKEQVGISDDKYIELVKKGIKHCERGDVFQIVLSRCYSQSFKGDDFKVYRALRSINPSPYLFYFNFGTFSIFGSSPETHCKISGKTAYIDPIAGTYKRTGNSKEDRLLSEKLLQDEKENAEHVMLVDLARNDLSRNCKNVKLDFYKNIQYFSHVIHLASRVIGEIEDNKSKLQVFADSFPAGTLSGAPKIRAMQLIRDIEPCMRGTYSGCIGFIGLNGDLNQAITIRSFLSKNNTLYYQAGAGVVAKSNPEMELLEVKNKLGALKKAIDLAEKLKN